MAAETASGPRSHALWIAPLLTLGGAISYFTVFARYPALRDFPWINLPLVAAGMLVAIHGLRQTFRRPAPRLGRVWAAVAYSTSVLVGVLFHLYVFVFSYALPDSADALRVGSPVPDFALRAANGRTVRLEDLRGRKVVLTFYRGFW